jgi:hypothetical protein
MMFLVLDTDGCLNIFDSVDAAQQHLEAIDIENDEYEFCDESGQPFVGELLPSRGMFSGGGFRIVERRSRDPGLPVAFIKRTRDFWQKGIPLRHLRMHVHIFHAHRPNQPIQLTPSRTALTSQYD